MGEKRGLELLRSVIDELDPNVECSELHSLFGDGEGGCLGRLCSSCQGEALRVALRQADEEMKGLKARLMPEGMEWLLEVWPKWSNGEYCKFGDWWKSGKYGEPEPKQFLKLSIYTPEQLREWGQDDGDHFGYEWDFMRPSDPKYRPDKVEPPAPKVLDADGVEIREGDEVWPKYPSDRDDEQVVRAIVLTLLGDGRVEVESEYPTGAKFHEYVQSDQLTHERPDSWERLEEDANATAGLFDAFDADASADIRNIVCRAKKLAGVE